jgi:hypothetical protein
MHKLLLAHSVGTTEGVYRKRSFVTASLAILNLGCARVYAHFRFDSIAFCPLNLTTSWPPFRLFLTMKPVLVLLSLIIFCQAVSAQTAKVVLKVGDKAPDFALPNGDGKTVSLSDYTSRGPVVVVFYRGFW